MWRRDFTLCLAPVLSDVTCPMGSDGRILLEVQSKSDRVTLNFTSCFGIFQENTFDGSQVLLHFLINEALS